MTYTSKKWQWGVYASNYKIERDHCKIQLSEKPSTKNALILDVKFPPQFYHNETFLFTFSSFHF